MANQLKHWIVKTVNHMLDTTVSTAPGHIVSLAIEVGIQCWPLINKGFIKAAL